MHAELLMHDQQFSVCSDAANQLFADGRSSLSALEGSTEETQFRCGIASGAMWRAAALKRSTLLARRPWTEDGRLNDLIRTRLVAEKTTKA